MTAADTEESRIKLDKCFGCAGHLRTHWPLNPEFPSRHASGECQAPAHETFKGLFLKKPHHLSWPHRFDLLLVAMRYGAHSQRPPHHYQASIFLQLHVVECSLHIIFIQFSLFHALCGLIYRHLNAGGTPASCFPKLARISQESCATLQHIAICDRRAT